MSSKYENAVSAKEHLARLKWLVGNNKDKKREFFRIGMSSNKHNLLIENPWAINNMKYNCPGRDGHWFYSICLERVLEKIDLLGLLVKEVELATKEAVQAAQDEIKELGRLL